MDARLRFFASLLVVVAPFAPLRAQELALPLAPCPAVTSADASEPCYHETDALFREADQPRSYAAIERELLERFRHEPWAHKGHLPEVGLSLSGGGSKSAPFVMGVLKRFADEGWLEETDLLSSVSGGGYAAYYLYSRAWMRARHPDLVTEQTFGDTDAVAVARVQDFFADIRTEQYGEDAAASVTLPDGSTVEGSYARYDVRTADVARYRFESRLTDAAAMDRCGYFAVDSRRHQAFVECYQDILSTTAGGTSNNTSSPPYLAYAGGLLSTVALLVPHHFANTLFDWKIGLAPSRWIYRKGIGRTYGTLPVNDRQPGTDLKAAEAFTFAELQALYSLECEAPCERIPWWIINTTNDVVRRENKESLAKTIFEITPRSFGSGTYGYVHGASIDELKAMTPLDSVAAAGAFFDTLSARGPGGFPEWSVFAGLHLFNIRWGYELPNFRRSRLARFAHGLLPFPLYMADPGWRRKSNSLYIRLADGGMSGDNLGVYSLLRRGTRHIVVADGGYDLDQDHRTSRLTELCVLSYTLMQWGYDVQFDGLPSGESGAKYWMSDLCDPAAVALRTSGETALHKAFDPYRWKRPVWTGTVRPKADVIAPAGPGAVLDGIKIYYLKSAIDGSAVADDAHRWFTDGSICRGGENPNPLTPKGFPCSLVGLRIDSRSKAELAEGRLNPDWWTWPQTSTVWTTANGSANTFKHYRDLGWYVAGALACEAGSVFHDQVRCGGLTSGTTPADLNR